VPPANRPILGFALVAAALLAGGPAAQEAAPLAGRLAAQEAARPALLERVVVLGASGSAGFGVAGSMADALRATFVDEPGAVRDESSSLFFLDPLANGANSVERARAADPTLVVAADFLFWFAYGLVNAEGKPLASDEERPALFEKGLALLADFGCPVVVGDLPDCSRAIGTMLLEAQVPAPATLAALNARLAEWAKGRPKVVVLPLAESVERLFAAASANSETEPAELELGGWTYPAREAAALLFQPDELHPTLDGLALIAHHAARGLLERGLVEPEAVRLERDAVLERLRQRRAKR
jgi:hypothetical protein